MTEFMDAFGLVLANISGIAGFIVAAVWAWSDDDVLFRRAVVLLLMAILLRLTVPA